MAVKKFALAVKKLPKLQIPTWLEDDEGSISVLTLGLFVLTVAILVLLTDIASIEVSKQSLVHVSESAAIRAAHNVDLAAYYRGTSEVSVPIDCSVAYSKVVEELNDWTGGGSDIRRPELERISLTHFSCSENRVQLSTSARTFLPFRLPQGLTSVEIHTTVEAQSDRVR